VYNNGYFPKHAQTYRIFDNWSSLIIYMLLMHFNLRLHWFLWCNINTCQIIFDNRSATSSTDQLHRPMFEMLHILPLPIILNNLHFCRKAISNDLQNWTAVSLLQLPITQMNTPLNSEERDNIENDWSVFHVSDICMLIFKQIAFRSAVVFSFN